MAEQVTGLAARLICVLKRLAAVCVFAACLASVPAAGAATFTDGNGLQVTAVKQIDARLYAITLKTRALPAPASVYVLLPPDYESQPDRRWPVFYLLDGTSGRASDWTSSGDAEKVIGDREVITVMPDITLNGDGGGWCSDWPTGAASWETFHIGQLLPWIDSNLRTLTTRGQRAIAGLSQGGFCSLSYAARHPDLFGVALGYSGAPDIYYDPVDRVGAMLIINATEMGLTHVAPDTFFGNPVTDGSNWAAHDPATIAENLRSTRMYMYWGNGLPGPLDPDPASGLSGADEIEGAVNQSNIDFQRRINALGIPAYFDAYGNGTHTWPYWKRDLQWSIDKIMADFANPAPTPAQFTYTSGEGQYRVYGWSVAIHSGTSQFTTLRAARRCGGFALSGNGSATVTTPACYRRGARYRVTTRPAGSAAFSQVVAAGKRRLALSVPLSTGTTTVTIKRAARR